MVVKGGWRLLAVMFVASVLLGTLSVPLSHAQQSSAVPRLSKDQLRSILLEVAEANDILALGSANLESYLDSLYAAQLEIPWASQVSMDLLRDYVVPVRFYPSYNLPTASYYPEKIENWRTPLYALAKNIIGSTTNPETAARLVHRWVYENIHYNSKNPPKYLQPTLILERKCGTCWQNAILLAAFYRSIFLPARVVVGASYHYWTAKADGTAIPGKDLELTVTEDHWISRDWNNWEKEISVYDLTAEKYLQQDEYSFSIVEVNEQGWERLVLRVPASRTLDHSFRVTLKVRNALSHAWVEMWIPTKGWTMADGEGETAFDIGPRYRLNQFDMQAYNPAKRTWVGSYFFYRFKEPIDTLLETTRTIIDEGEAKAHDVALAKSCLAKAEELYNSVRSKVFSYEDRQATGEYIYQLCGTAITSALSNDSKSLFLNVWEATAKSPHGLASALSANMTRNVGVILPYNVFDLSKVKELYTLGRGGVASQEVKRVYYWLDSFRSSLPRGTNIYIVILGYDPVTRQWKATLNIADPSMPLESTKPLRDFSPSLRFKIDGLASDWADLKPVITDPKGDSRKNTPGTDLKAVYALGDSKYLYAMFELWGKPDPGNSYIFPVDLNGDRDWDYSFGFDENYAWMYDLRDVPNGEWPRDKMSTIAVPCAVEDVAEIAIPLDILGSPEKIDMLAWIYYSPLGRTVDDTNYGTVMFTKTATASMTTVTKISGSSHSTTVVTGGESLVPPSDVTPIAAATIVVAALLSAVLARRRRLVNVSVRQASRSKVFVLS